MRSLARSYEEANRNMESRQFVLQEWKEHGVSLGRRTEGAIEAVGLRDLDFMIFKHDKRIECRA